MGGGGRDEGAKRTRNQRVAGPGLEVVVIVVGGWRGAARYGGSDRTGRGTSRHLEPRKGKREMGRVNVCKLNVPRLYLAREFKEAALPLAGDPLNKKLLRVTRRVANKAKPRRVRGSHLACFRSLLTHKLIKIKVRLKRVAVEN